jgi:NCAIR mutase (PurE)-related protein
MYHILSSEHNFKNGTITYHPLARIISMHVHISPLREQTSFDDTSDCSGSKDATILNAPESNNGSCRSEEKRVVIATAGTTDIMVAEEAAVTLEASSVPVDRIYDVGVAGLHRILSALPKLNDPSVGCIIVCAGMDGALPSVVGGLVQVPVIAVPTSIGYGAAFNGVSALLTMLNSCAPGVCVMNIDNGFGAAAFAYKCLQICKSSANARV